MWKFFMTHLRFTSMIAIVLTLIGTVSILQIPKEANPEIEIPVAVVTTVFPGANALDVESFVTNEIEDSLANLADIDEVTSTSGQGVSSVVLQFDIGTDMQEKLNDIRSAVERAKVGLPTDAEEPIVQQVSFNDRPIKVFTLGGDYSSSQLRGFAELLKDELSRVSGVSDIMITGGVERQAYVAVDPQLLDQFGLSLTQVVGAIMRADTNVPIGTIETNNQRYSVRFDGQISSVDSIANLPVGAVGGQPVFVRDVAELVDGFEERTSRSRLWTGEGELVEAVTIGIQKAPGGNVLDVIRRADEVINEAPGTILPFDVVVEVVDDDAEYVRRDLTGLSESGLQTTLIVFLLMIVFLGWREAILAGLAIPMTFAITFIFLVLFGETLNFLTLFSLILALGILVDAAVVMVEGIHVNRLKGMKPLDAAMMAVKEFQAPLISGTLTTVFAFLPMMMTSGLIGQFIKAIPVTVSLVLFSALFVALAMIPSFSLFQAEERRARQNWFARTGRAFRSREERFMQNVKQRYALILDGFIASKWRRRSLGLVLTLAFIASLSLPVMGVLKVDMFPASDLERIYIDVTLPAGGTLEPTERVLDDVAAYLQGDPSVASYLVTAGAGSPLTGGGGLNRGSAVVNLVARAEREDSRIISERYDRELKRLVNDATLSVQQLSSGPEGGAPVEVRITGPDLQVLESIADEYALFVRDLPGTRNVDTTIGDVPGEFIFSLDRTELARFGVTASDVAGALRTAIFGVTATTVKEIGEDVDVIVKYELGLGDIAASPQVVPDQVLGLTMQTPVGDIPFRSFLSSRLESGRAVVQHRDGERIVRVTSGVKVGVTPQEIFSVIREDLEDRVLPEGYEISLGGEDEELNQTLADLGKAMFLGIVLIAGLLILQFNSFRQPVFVLSSIPLALIGVLPGLALIGQPLSFPGMIGIVALAGIVVNNGIILIDRLNENQKAGMSREEAVHEACVSRFQPIMLTTATTVAGMLPLVISQPDWGPLGFSIIFGLMFSTILTLLVVPMLYYSFGRKNRGLSKTGMTDVPNTPNVFSEIAPDTRA